MTILTAWCLVRSARGGNKGWQLLFLKLLPARIGARRRNFWGLSMPPVSITIRN
jgi:hypothetical protein